MTETLVKCHNCNLEISVNDKFCMNCGTNNSMARKMKEYVPLTGELTDLSSLKNLSEKIAELAYVNGEYETQRDYFTDLNKEYNHNLNSVIQLKENLNSIEDEIDSLNSFGLKSISLKISGKHNKKLQEVQKEYNQTAISLQLVQEQLSDQKNRIENVKTQYHEISQLRNKLKDMIKARDKLMHKLASKVETDEIINLKKRKISIESSLEPLVKEISLYEKVRSNLKSANGSYGSAARELEPQKNNRTWGHDLMQLYWYERDRDIWLINSISDAIGSHERKPNLDSIQTMVYFGYKSLRKALETLREITRSDQYTNEFEEFIKSLNDAKTQQSEYEAVRIMQYRVKALSENVDGMFQPLKRDYEAKIQMINQIDSDLFVEQQKAVNDKLD